MKLTYNLIGFAISLLLFSCQTTDKPKMPDSKAGDTIAVPDSLITSETDAKLRFENLKDSFAHHWRYDTTEDKMSVAPVFTAALMAREPFNLSFPYDSVTYGSLMIRKKHGQTNVKIMVSSGQFQSSINGTTVDVKFDDQNTLTFGAYGPLDNRSTELFIKDIQKFLKDLRKSKHLELEANFYHDGLRQMEFFPDSLRLY